jgi:hypothetical protein
MNLFAISNGKLRKTIEKDWIVTLVQSPGSMKGCMGPSEDEISSGCRERCMNKSLWRPQMTVEDLV